MSERQRLISTLDREFSRLVRQKSANFQGYVKCCTCGVVKDWKVMQLSHYRKRGNVLTRWIDSNCGVACYDCNMVHDGKPEEMRDYLVEKYGEKEVQRVEALSRRIDKVTNYELKEILNEIKSRSNN